MSNARIESTGLEDEVNRMIETAEKEYEKNLNVLHLDSEQLFTK